MHPGCAAHLQLVLQPLQLLLTDATAKLDKPPPHTYQPIGLILLLQKTAGSSQAAAAAAQDEQTGCGCTACLSPAEETLKRIEVRNASISRWNSCSPALPCRNCCQHHQSLA